jgi:flagellar hook-associated protein 3 FlgL
MSIEFRTTQRSLADTALTGLQSSLNRYQQLQQKLSSGVEVSRPSDSPVDTVSIMQLRADQGRTDQYARNASDGADLLGTADTALTTMLNDIRRLRDLTAQGISGAQSPDALAAAAAEVESIRADLLAQANTRYLGRPIFAGTADVTDAYDTSGNYLGNAGIAKRTVGPGTSVEVNVPGPDAFGPAGNDLFALAQQVADDLRSNPSNLSSRLDQIDTSLDTVQNQLATVGARYNRVDTMRDLNNSRSNALANQLADVQGVDIPKTIMELQLQQTAYQAALGATARVVQPTLMDFLK